jgi:hypothetical protein
VTTEINGWTIELLEEPWDSFRSVVAVSKHLKTLIPTEANAYKIDTNPFTDLEGFMFTLKLALAAVYQHPDWRRLGPLPRQEPYLKLDPVTGNVAFIFKHDNDGATFLVSRGKYPGNKRAGIL